MTERVAPLPANPSRIDTVDCAALGYLALPNVIFIWGWIRSPWGLVAALLVAAAVIYLMRGATKPQSSIPRSSWVVAGVCAFLWLAISGVGHLVYANSDWLVRDVVLHDLATLPWPVQYKVASAPGVMLLRAPLGYFLPTALAARVFGFGISQIVLFGWTFIGVVLCFRMLAARTTSTRAVGVLIAVFVFFSGLDIVGMVIEGKLPDLGDHLEWWASYFQYSSDTTQLFWVPNHALPAWIVTLWIVKVGRDRMPLGFAIAMVALTPIWSPLASIGLAPLVAAMALRDGLFALNGSAKAFLAWLRQLANPGMIVIAATTLLLVDPFLLMASGSVPAGWVVEHRDMLAMVRRVALFVTLEFGIYWILMLYRYRFDLLLTTSGLILLLLPWYQFGPGSDLTMRASIPALVVFAVRLADWFVERLVPEPGTPVSGDAAASFAMLVFVVGMITPAQEMIRPFTVSASPMDVSASVFGITHGDAPHYLTQRKGAWADRFLAMPAYDGTH